ncbi:pentapeptide repeat-containing protein [Rathayibacter soli]|uniref:pentapeptide repeat-containing protein n=1 Tax=Rathayibacter soli TaxID=3144168 RepID=UPI00390800FE
MAAFTQCRFTQSRFTQSRFTQSRFTQCRFTQSCVPRRRQSARTAPREGPRPTPSWRSR